ncbi:MAG: oligosaccharide flippase family protein [Actinomyces sp.]|uniref:lipopolysaccharide biosynthesis protein n=1 Tax=Actinomyces sp. TaxID=29317 RepID=UPI0026DA7E1B|nr:oligosaccharide flippase family protein [Actinomyces sp.]MDO4243409.1 oligosaccharide flippase family protein [Actinomyces sp.]
MSPRLPGSGSSVDSLLLAGVKVVTLSTGIVSTMVLSHSLSLHAYGTYAQGVLLVTLCADMTVLGLADAVNYFFNRDDRRRSSQEYVRTVLVLQVLTGLATALVLLALRGAIGAYFDNSALEPLVVLLALRPMLTNMTTVLQVLVVSIGRARTIAVRNLVFSALKLAAVVVTALLTSSIATLLGMLLVLDVLSVLWFWDAFRRGAFAISWVRLHWGMVKEVFAFCLPMAVYVMTASLMRQVGALVIGMNESTQMYAVYANCTTILPFDVVATSFLTVIIPVMTRYIGAGRRDRALELFGRYLSVGFLTTVTFCLACLVVAPEFIQVLYGARYLPGEVVFRLSLVTAMIRFAGLSLILSASGRTRTLMAVSLVAVAANAVLCVVLYEVMGFVGPALASVVVNLVMAGALVHLSLRQLGGRASAVLPARGLALYAVSAAGACLAGWALRSALTAVGLAVPAVAVLVFCAVSAAVLALNAVPLVTSLRAINSMK